MDLVSGQRRILRLGRALRRLSSIRSLSAGDVAGGGSPRSAPAPAGSSTSSRRPARRTSWPWSRPTRSGCCGRTRGDSRPDHLPEGDRRSAAADRRSRLRLRRSACCTTFPNPTRSWRPPSRAAPGGRLAVWLYGREGNTLYLLLVRSLWWLTRRLPHRLLELFVRLLYPLFWCYMTACRVAAAPARRLHAPCDAAADAGQAPRRHLRSAQSGLRQVLHARRGQDVLARHGFIDIRLHHRHGISWTVVGTKA